MPNPIKYTTGSETLALKKGNFYIGTGDVGKGPTSSTGYYNGITPPSGGYTIYLNKETGGPSIYTAANDAQLISLTNSIAGQSYTTANECLVYFAGQTDKMVLNRNYEGIVTDGLVLNLDAGFTPSYPRSGTTWTDLSLSGNNGTLTNGPTFSGGSIVFDGVDDYVDIPSTSLNFVNQPITLSSFIRVNTLGSEGGTNIFFSKDRFGSNRFTQFVINPSDKLRLLLQNGINSGDFVGNGPNLTKNIHQVSVVITSQNVIFYLNGTQYGDIINNPDGVLPNYPSGSVAWRINRLNADFFGDFIGNTTIYISQIYNRALSTTEVLQNYNAQKGRFGL